MKASAPAAGLCVLLALVFFVMAVMYATGNLQLLTSQDGKHFKHGVLFAALGVLALVGANFLRPRNERLRP